MSKARQKKMVEYMKLKKKFLGIVEMCQRCGKAKAVDLHHTRGRAGSLLTDWRFFMALCRHCHNWIQDNPAEARHAGLIAGPGEWNTPLKQVAD